MDTDLERLLRTDLNYYAGDPDLDTATVDFTVERKRLLNWAYRTISKLCYIIDPNIPFEPVSGEPFYSLHPARGLVQIVSLGGATGGTFTLTFNGQTTAATNYNASTATVVARLEALSNIGVGEVTVTAVGNGYRVEFGGTLGTPPTPLMTITSSLTGTTTTPEVRQEGFGQRVVKLMHMVFDDTVSLDYYGREGIYSGAQFDRRYRSWRDFDQDSPRVAIDRGNKIQIFPTPSDDYITSGDGRNFAVAQIVLDDLVNDLDIPEIDHEAHEGIVQLAAFRASDPTLDEQGAIRRSQSLGQRWVAEVEEIRKRNRNAAYHVGHTKFIQGMRFQS